jgi:hypothetical protein
LVGPLEKWIPPEFAGRNTRAVPATRDQNNKEYSHSLPVLRLKGSNSSMTSPGTINEITIRIIANCAVFSPSQYPIEKLPRCLTPLALLRRDRKSPPPLASCSNHVASLVGTALPVSLSDVVASLVGVACPVMFSNHVASLVGVASPASFSKALASLVGVACPVASSNQVASLVGVTFLAAMVSLPFCEWNDVTV